MKGHKHSEETKKKIGKVNSISVKKLWQNPEYRKHMIEVHKGQVGNMLGKHHSEKTKEKLRQANLGKKLSEETKRKISEANKGKIRTPEMRKKYSKAKKGRKASKETRRKMSGKNCHWWKGGITPENKRIKNSIEWHLWRESVFARDNWTCQKTGERGGKITPHHIQNFAQFPELRTSINNGITLSKKAHDEFHKIYGFRNNTKEQLEEFLGRKI